MSNEITLYASIKASKGETVISKIVSALKVDWTGNRFVHNRQSVGITEEALDLGDISTGGLFLAINQDGVNFVELRAGQKSVFSSCLRAPDNSILEGGILRGGLPLEGFP